MLPLYLFFVLSYPFLSPPQIPALPSVYDLWPPTNPTYFQQPKLPPRHPFPLVHPIPIPSGTLNIYYSVSVYLIVP